MRRLRILDAYIAKEFLFSFFVAFLFFFVIFFVNQLLLMAEDILSKKAPVRDVLLLLLYAIPAVVAMSVPFASLVGALMAAGRFASDSELLVMEASGIPMRRVLRPFLGLGLILALLSFAANDVFLPLGTLEFGKLYRKLLVSTPALELRPWSTRRYKDVTVVTGEVQGNQVTELVLFDKTEEGRARVISADKARLEIDTARQSLVLHLDGVWTQTMKAAEPERFEYSTCASMRYMLPLREGDASRVSIGPREMSSLDLGRVVLSKRRDFEERKRTKAAEILAAQDRLKDRYFSLLAGETGYTAAANASEAELIAFRRLKDAPLRDRTLQLYRLEYNKKFALPAGAFAFVLLSFPLGIRARRQGRSVGFGLGLLVAVLYWALLLGGQTLGTRLAWSPFWAMWLPNVVVLCAGMLLGFLGRRGA